MLFGGWGDRAARKTGDYDILIYDTGAARDVDLDESEK